MRHSRCVMRVPMRSKWNYRSGSICTTRIIAGIGVPQISAISNVADALKWYSTDSRWWYPFFRRYGKALAAVHLVSWWVLYLQVPKKRRGKWNYSRSLQNYRGMGSLGAMSGQNGSSDRYFQRRQRGRKIGYLKVSKVASLTRSNERYHQPISRWLTFLQWVIQAVPILKKCVANHSCACDFGRYERISRTWRTNHQKARITV